MNTQIFREYDVRGLHETDLTDPVVTDLGRAFGTYVRRQGGRTVALGRDFRPSSPRLAAALEKGLLETGCVILRAGVLPTPGLYWSIVHLSTDAGVQVTGSHNPSEYNGFKMNLGLASIHGEQIQLLRKMIETRDFDLRGTAGAAGERGETRETPTEKAYMDMLASKVKPKRNLKVVIDAGNGCAGPVAPDVFRRVGAEVIELFTEPDGTYPNHQPDPTVEANLQDLIRRVKETGADLGIGYDGDADRVGAVDERGRIVWGDTILALLAREVLAKHPGAPIVFDVKCSQGLEEDILAHGGRPVMGRTGHSVMKARMKEERAPLAGELSGHIFFQDEYFGFDDGIYVSLRLLRYVADSGETLGALADSVPHYFATPEIRVDTTDEEKFEIVERVTRHFAADHDVITIDGARVKFGDGWALVRASNTQPVLVLRFEAKTEARLAEIRSEVLAVLAQEGVRA
ncbi:MAG: phosphomannomutase/phosphoglucomutase [Candidatus Eiseniibacteriota bacterium]